MHTGTGSVEAKLEAIQQSQEKILRLLAMLLDAIQEEDQPTQAHTLDGEAYPNGERDQSQPL